MAPFALADGGHALIRFIQADQLDRFPRLKESMFRDRADQFKARLGWQVSVDACGHERDEYDSENPLYVIVQAADGGHLGSMRFLPTTGPNMIDDHFGHLLGGHSIADKGLWECTRFCLSRKAGPQVAGRLMSAGGEILRGFGLAGFAGVFDQRMIRIYNRIGSKPEILGSQGEGRDKISVGIWRFSDAARARVARRSGLSEVIVHHWFRTGFGDRPHNPFDLAA